MILRLFAAFFSEWSFYSAIKNCSAAYFSKSAGCGGVAADAIGAEPARPGSPVTACDFAFIRSNGSLETPLMFRPEQMHAKDVSNLGASFGAYSGRVLSGTSRECVPGGRALSCSLEFLLCMDAF